MKKYNTLAALIILLGMVGTAEYFHEQEIIFPEILALLIGALIMPSQPWQVSKTKLVLLMSLSSLAGIFIVRYIPIYVWFQMAIAFLFTAVSLMLSRTTLVPMISACILPILLQTTSFIYPLAVFLLCLAIVLMQALLEKNSCLKKQLYHPYNVNLKEESTIWLKRLLVLLIIAFIPCYTKEYYFIAPPLIVSFVELTKPSNKLMQCRFKLIFLIALTSVIGTASRLIITELCMLPLTLCAFLATLCTLYTMQKMHLFFPPAGALAILPTILPAKHLIYYPVKVVIGLSFFILFTLFVFPSSRCIKNEHLTL